MKILGKTNKELYEIKNKELETKESKVKSVIEKLEVKKNDTEETRWIIDSFKKFLSQHQVLEEFDKDVFRIVIDHIVIGGFDENGNAYPYIIDLFYKNWLGKRKNKDPLVIRDYALQNAYSNACGNGVCFIT